MLDFRQREEQVADIVFYQIPISHFCEKVRWALDFKGVPYRSVCVNPFTRKELAELSGDGQVPVIRDGERIVSDSSLIIEYLEEICPEPPLIPPKEPERGEALELEHLADEKLGPAVRRVAYSAFFSDAATFRKVMLRKKGLTRLLNPLRRVMVPFLIRRHFGISNTQLAADRQSLCALLHQLDARLDGRPHLVGNTLTIADITVASLLGPLEIVKDLSESTEHTKIFSWARETRSRHGRRSWSR